MRRKPKSILPIYLLVGCTVLGFLARLWNVLTVFDELGLPKMHQASTAALVAVSLVSMALFIAMGYLAPCRSPKGEAMAYSHRGKTLGVIAAALMIVGAAGEFADQLLAGPTIYDPILALLGVVAGICLMAVAVYRERGKQMPGVELAPICYLLLKLTLNFKTWSADPIILDYCMMLFALIFTTLTFYHSAGFVFDRGKPKRTLFYAMAAVYFCGTTLAEGGFGVTITYLGFMLWFLPVIYNLLIPSRGASTPEAAGNRKEKK